MGIPREPDPAKLIIGLIFQPDFLEPALMELEKHFGPISLRSEIIPFDTTNYYEAEMGQGLLRQWIAFKNLIEQDRIVEIKLKTNEIERMFMDGGRRVNIDPGYVTESKLVLATTKNYAHRIYLREGIYAEVTLIFKRKEGFTPLGWTYPDYTKDVALRFFNMVREELKRDLREFRARNMGLDVTGG